ncbi:unnamed protein product [Linum trigynum]|uniref:Uncharacterized protein n=1 Tax=Linum trigynum TaxID=586398 RepID=A0AAV2DF14_9ROSI
MFCLYQKLKQVKITLKKLNRTHYYDIHERVLVARAALAVAQLEGLERPSHETLEAKRGCKVQLLELQRAEELFLRQKSRQLWILI